MKFQMEQNSFFSKQRNPTHKGIYSQDPNWLQVRMDLCTQMKSEICFFPSLSSACLCAGLFLRKALPMWQNDGQAFIPPDCPPQQKEHFCFQIVSKKFPRIIHIKKVWVVWLRSKAKLSNFKQRIQMVPKENRVVVTRRMGMNTSQMKSTDVHSMPSLPHSKCPGCSPLKFYPSRPTLYLFAKIIFDCQAYNYFVVNSEGYIKQFKQQQCRLS